MMIDRREIGTEITPDDPPIWSLCWFVTEGNIIEPFTCAGLNRGGYREYTDTKTGHKEWLRQVVNVQRLPKKLTDMVEEMKIFSEGRPYLTILEVFLLHSRRWEGVVKNHLTELLSLHTEECPGCPVDRNTGRLVFSR